MLCRAEISSTRAVLETKDFLSANELFVLLHLDTTSRRLAHCYRTQTSHAREQQLQKYFSFALKCQQCGSNPSTELEPGLDSLAACRTISSLN
jgi:hypothetical protein